MHRHAVYFDAEDSGLAFQELWRVAGHGMDSTLDLKQNVAECMTKTF